MINIVVIMLDCNRLSLSAYIINNNYNIIYIHIFEGHELHGQIVILEISLIKFGSHQLESRIHVNDHVWHLEIVIAYKPRLYQMYIVAEVVSAAQKWSSPHLG